MALPLLHIIRELAPLIVQAGGVAAGLRSSGGANKIEDRVGKLERETQRAGEVLAGVAEQLQALALELRAQAEVTEKLRRKAQQLLVISAAAAGVALVAAVVVFVR